MGCPKPYSVSVLRVFFNEHDCHKTEGCGDVNLISGKNFLELREATQEITSYLKNDVGVNVIEMYECEWERMKVDQPEIEDFIQTSLPKSPSSFPSSIPITKASIVRAVYDGRLFGLVRCNISVPESLRAHFSEMPPIFKNIEVSREDIGSVMGKYADERKLLGQPRRTLIRSFIGKNIFMETQLLRWYLEHGLAVDQVYEVVEYVPERCFQGFADTLSENRQNGNLNPTKAILAETFKLLRNLA